MRRFDEREKSLTTGLGTPAKRLKDDQKMVENPGAIEGDQDGGWGKEGERSREAYVGSS